MGAIVSLGCDECGFVSGPMGLGGGFFDFTWRLTAPALCRACHMLVLDNYLDPAGQCPGCDKRGTLVFYDQPELRRTPAEAGPRQGVAQLDSGHAPSYKTTARVRAKTACALPAERIAAAAAGAGCEAGLPTAFEWRIGDTDQHFRLPADYLRCPQCGQFTMHADELGNWD